MSEVNAATLEAYKNGVSQYASATSSEVSPAAQEWMGSAVAGLPPEASILEIGSGLGRDAAYLKTLGYSILCSDATPGFVELLQQQSLRAVELNVATDELGGPYDLILANAVLLHFKRQEVPPIICKMADSLTAVGRLALRLKSGTGEGLEQGKLDSPCYFSYWAKSEMEDLLGCLGFVSHITETAGRSGSGWLNIIAYQE